MRQSFHWSDYLVFVFWLSVYSAIGIYHRYRCQINGYLRRVLRRYKRPDEFRESEAEDLFLSNRQLSLIPVVASLMASFLSAVSLLGTTAESYVSGLQFVCLVFAYFIAFSITSEMYMPVFYKLRLSCAHEYLELRFGKTVRFGASIMFCLQMWVYIALALYAPALALSQVSGLPTWLSIVSTGTVATFYTSLGGIRAVVWTDAIQLTVLTTGLLLIAILGIKQVGGIERLWTVALEGKRLQSFNLDPNPFIRHTVWSLTFGGAGMVMSVFATNQTQIQRYLACRDILTARRAILLNIPFNAVFLAIQLFCGLVVYACFIGCDPLRSGLISRHDQLLPYFVMLIFENTPVIRGLFLSVIFAAALSTVSSGVNSLANVWIEDLIQPWNKIICGRSIRPRTKSLLAVALSAFIGMATVGMAFFFAFLSPRVLQFSFVLFGAIGGPILAVFTLGIFMPCINSKGATVAFVSSVVIGLAMSVGSILNPVHSSNLPLSVENCSTNITILPPSNVTASAPANAWSIYSLSYLYYSLVCFLTATVVGLVVSALSGFNTRTPVSTRLLAKQAVAVYSRMPNWLPPQTFQDHSCGNDGQITPICGAVDRSHHKNTYLVHAVAAYTPDKSRSFCQAVS